jgi:iron complex transport system substrate-binding protein
MVSMCAARSPAIGPRLKARCRTVAELALLLAFLCCSCARPSNGPSAAHHRESLSRIDALGRQLRLPPHPERIISLAPSVTEVLYLVGASDRLIGVTTQCDWPEAALRKPKIGDLLNPNYERLLEARPDLIIASTAGNDRGAILKMTDLGLPVYVTAPRSLDGIYDTVRAIGQITDCAEAAERLTAQTRARFVAVQNRLAGLAHVRAFFITWFDPLLAPGHNTFETDILRRLGIESISATSEQFYPRYSLEQVLAADPDMIITVRHAGDPLPDLTRVAGWQRLRAVRTGKVFVLPETFQHPSPRFVDAVEDLSRKLVPERNP